MANEYQDWRCCWHNGSQRCAYPGSVSEGIRGGGPWYCGVHFHTRSGPLAQHALEQSQQYRQGDRIAYPKQAPAGHPDGPVYAP